MTGKVPTVRVLGALGAGPSICAIASLSSLISGARMISRNCATLVALAIGAVMLGRAIIQASATCAGFAL